MSSTQTSQRRSFPLCQHLPIEPNSKSASRNSSSSILQFITAEILTRLEIYTNPSFTNSRFITAEHSHQARNLHCIPNNYPHTYIQPIRMSVLATHLLPGSKRTFSKESQDSITLLKGLGVEGDLHCGEEDQHEYNRRQDTKKVGKIRKNLRQVHLIQSELYEGAEFHGLDGQRVKPGQLGENITTVGIDLGALGEGTKLFFVDEQPVEETAKEGNEKQKMSLPLMGHHIGFYIIPIALALLAILTSKSNTILYLSLALILILSTTFIITHHLSPHPTPPSTAPIVKLTGLRVPCSKIDVFKKGLKAKCQLPNDGNKPGMIGGVMGVVERGGVVRPGMKIVVRRAWVWRKLPHV